METRSANDASGFSLNRAGKILFGFVGTGLLCLASGCSSVGMKGTPFYTGDYVKRQGPAEQRVNVWPLFYYRDPALSVLWPIFELTDDHTAVRPLFSVYGLDRTNREYSVLWPLTEFDLESGANRIFPVFWGDDYFAVFPLYWHFGEPWGAAGGSDSLFPLWIIGRDTTNRFNVYCPWPLVHFWSDRRTDTGGSTVFPVFSYRRDDGGSRFYSLLWSSDRNPNGDYWRLLVPLYYQSSTERGSTLWTPLWAQGESSSGDWKAAAPLWIQSHDSGGGSSLFCPWPLLRFWSDPETEGHGSMLLPLYWHQRDEARSQFYSLPWSSSVETNGNHWRLLAPLFYQSGDENGSLLITPLWQQGESGERNWQAVAPFWIRSREGTNRFSLYSPWPLAHFWFDRTDDSGGRMVFPLYYQGQREGNSQFYSLLWFSRTDRNGDYYRLLPPLFFQSSKGDNSVLITPLWAQGRTATNDWRAIIPLCYWDRQQHTLLSPLWANWQTDDTETWLAPWLLSWKTQSPDRSDLWLLAPLAHMSWGPKAGPSHVFPLYYRAPANHMLLSPVWLQWQKGDTETAFAPWLLSWKTRAPDRTDLWMAGGLARASWGEKAGGDYVFPIFYHDSDRLLTPLFGWDDVGDYTYVATPLAGVRTDQHSGSWIFPLYSHSRDKESGDVKDNYLLLGGYTKNRQTSHSWFIPLFNYRNRFEPAPPSGGRPFRTYGKTFWCLPICWYYDQFYLRPGSHSTGTSNAPVPWLESTNTADLDLAEVNARFARVFSRGHGAFPLWSYDSDTTPSEGLTNNHGSILLWLYRYKHTVGPQSGNKPGVSEDYTRAQVLWRLWHYERLNGDVSVDVFPSFTYDRKTDGFKKVSFLWRFFRYERPAGGGRSKLDVLFIPLKR